MNPSGDANYLRVLQAFLLVVTLAPITCCAGCLGLGAVTSFLSRPAAPPPPTPRDVPPPP
jgi:hypothetical protein